MTTLDDMLARVLTPVVTVDLAKGANVCVHAGEFAAFIRAVDLIHYLCVDVYPFVAGEHARGSAVGMDNGRKYPAFGADAPGRSHGAPAVSLVTVLIGQQSPPAPGRWEDLTPAERVVVSLLDTAAQADNSPHVVEFTSEQLRELVPADLAERLAGYRTEAD